MGFDIDIYLFFALYLPTVLLSAMTFIVCIIAIDIKRHIWCNACLGKPIQEEHVCRTCGRCGPYRYDSNREQ